ncbi:transcriptional regulator BetI [Tropicimonas sp. IMCC34011]|uniref:choline-binding transcriptional repressor BetI n=1 Tax=Tropicimonas sp. IMCC34011 TaxID=2248759 RepID=UPI0018E59B86|nr:transcriptional regulator BetI [Tropicimonas sp. IMCC34011]
MEPIRKEALLKATIREVGSAGTLEVPVSRIARSAGMSAALAHHYFGGKDRIFLAAMRYILSEYGRGVRAALTRASGPRERLAAILRASFEDPNFRNEVIGAWLVFYIQARNSPETARLLRIYHRRLASNLICELRPLVGDRAVAAGAALGALIDGVYLRHAVGDEEADAEAAEATVYSYLDLVLAQGRLQ